MTALRGARNPHGPVSYTHLDVYKRQIEQLALTHPNVQKFVGDAAVKKVIVVPNKLINVVI